LQGYLAQSPLLQALYFAKQLNGLFVMKHLKRKPAKQMLPKLLTLLEQFEQSPARVGRDTAIMDGTDRTHVALH